jgi:hypothetical protein
VRSAQRITQAPGPWVHADFQRGTIDANALGRDLAAKVDPNDPTLIPLFTKFFLNTAAFDRESCSPAALKSELETSLRADQAKQMLGLPGSENAPKQAKNTRAQDWAIKKLVPVAFADQLAWVAQPTNLAPPVDPKIYQCPSNMARRVSADLSPCLLIYLPSFEETDVMADWWDALCAAHIYWKKEPAAFSPSTHTEQDRLSRFEELRNSARKASGTAARCNIDTLVYTVKALLMV